MTTMKTEKKQNDRKAPAAGQRTLPAQMLEQVAGGREYLTITLHDVLIGGY